MIDQPAPNTQTPSKTTTVIIVAVVILGLPLWLAIGLIWATLKGLGVLTVAASVPLWGPAHQFGKPAPRCW